MAQPLAPCPSCSRHVRANDGSCPFCGVALRILSVVPNATSRLARGALFAFASTLAACGGTTEAAPADTGALDGSKDGSSDARVDAPIDTGNIAPPYGIPPMDSGVDDGTVTDTGDPMADYGAPPPPADGG